MEDQHVYHHYDNDGPRVNVKVEHNSRGTNWEVTVTGAKTVGEALAMLNEAETTMYASFGPKSETEQPDSK